MSDCIDLSPHTYIEGGYCYTTSAEVAAAWDDIGEPAYTESEPVWNTGGVTWWNFIDLNCDRWRIPVSALPAVYGYREGESFWWRLRFPRPEFETAREWSPTPEERWLHWRAIVPCGGNPLTLNRLWEVIEEVHHDRA